MDQWRRVFCSDERPARVFFYNGKLSEWSRLFSTWFWMLPECLLLCAAQLSFLYRVPPTCVEASGCSPGWADPLTWRHTPYWQTVYIDLCVIVCAKIPQGMNLSFFFPLLCTFTHTIQSLSLVAIFFLAFSLNAETDAWQTTSCMCGRSSESLVYSWSTSYTALNDKSLILCYTVRFAQWANIL